MKEPRKSNIDIASITAPRRPRFLIRHGIPFYIVHLYRLDDVMFPPCEHKNVQEAIQCILKHNRCMSFDLEVERVVEKFYCSDGHAVPITHEL